MEEFKSQKIKSAIKALLKKKNLKYEDLAEELECSLPTVKRILGPEELTLNRLFQICDILDISLSELEAFSEEGTKETETFTKEQDEFLAKNRNYFAYLMKLYSGETPKKIAEKYNLTQRSTDKYLIGLERLELIRVTGKQIVKTAFKNSPNIGSGKLAKAYFESLIQNAGNFFIQNIHEAIIAKSNPDESSKKRSGSKFGIQAVKVTRATYEAWMKENSQAVRNFEKLASFEEKTKDPSELMTAVLVDAGALVPHNDPSLKLIENALGDIINL